MNDKRWLEEINIYYSRHANDKIEMTVEKLQIIVGTLVQLAFKARWLSWWNSLNMNKKALHFLLLVPTEAKLRIWLVKACFWVEFKEAATVYFNDMVENFWIELDYSSFPSLDTINDYVEQNMCALWDHVYSSFFMKKSKYDCGEPFLKQKNTIMAMQRLMYKFGALLLKSIHYFLKLNFYSFCVCAIKVKTLRFL